MSTRTVLVRGAGAEGLSHAGAIRTNFFPFHSLLLRCKQRGKESSSLLSILLLMTRLLPLKEEGSSSEGRLGFLPSAPSWACPQKMDGSTYTSREWPSFVQGQEQEGAAGMHMDVWHIKHSAAWHSQHLVATDRGQQCQRVLWMALPGGEGFLNKSPY